jgi:2,4-dichlorophenol 6-monooxygenase
VGDPELEVEIERSSVWYVNQAYATEYSPGPGVLRRRRRASPPAVQRPGPQHLRAGRLQSGLEARLRHQGPRRPRLLDSYSAERAPVGRQIVARANQSRLDYAPLKAAFRVEGADNPVAAGIARFKDPGPEGVAARRAVQAALELKNTEFNAQGVEMNQRYVSRPWCPTRPPARRCGGATAALPAGHHPPGGQDSPRLAGGRRGIRVSTLDVTGKGCFSLVTGLAGVPGLKRSMSWIFPICGRW